MDSVFVRREERTVNEAVQRINRGRYQLDPDFQRTFVWEPLKQSKLIELCSMRISLPVFYVAEAKDGRIIVRDGLQRLTTLQRGTPVTNLRSILAILGITHHTRSTVSASRN